MTPTKRHPRRYVIRCTADQLEELAWPRGVIEADHDAGVMRLVVGPTTYEAPLPSTDDELGAPGMTADALTPAEHAAAVAQGRALARIDTARMEREDRTRERVMRMFEWYALGLRDGKRDEPGGAA